jgi:hypothetical protein
MTSTPSSEIRGHHAASSVADITRYVLKLHVAPITRAATSAHRLKRRRAQGSPPAGTYRKNAQVVRAAIGSKTNRAAITVTP